MAKTRAWVLALGAAATLWGCAKEDAQQCEVVGVGTGACCTITLPDGRTAEGACIDNLCRNGQGANHAFANESCGSPPTVRDAAHGLADMGHGIGPGDASVRDMGGAGGAGGAMGGSGGSTGGAGGAGGSAGGTGGSVGGTGGATGGAGGVMPDRCAGVQCAGGERCDPATGHCVRRNPGLPATACTDDAECQSGDCLSEMETMGGVPGGFCRQDCDDDGQCGAGRVCLPSGQSRLCFEQCSPQTNCRDHWACIANPGSQVSVCLPDCREAGCGQGLQCNPDTGACDPEPVPCPYPCAAGEQCQEGHCVRLNGTCVTDYHCAVNTEQCSQGRCVKVEFTACQGAAECDRTQTCVITQPGNPGICLFSCQSDDACPRDRSCLNSNDGPICYPSLCGQTADFQNGSLYGSCQAGSMGQWSGTCLPVAVGDPAMPNDFGVCLEAGNVPEGGTCDAQVTGRDPGAANLVCAPGSLCFDDPDDPLDPEQHWDRRGACAGLCDPRNPSCSAGRHCVDFSSPDDASTADVDETRYVGLCLQSDCAVSRDDCGAGRHCRPYTLTADQGLCGAAGASDFGQPCQSHADCSGQAFCGNTGDGAICLQICDPAQANACPQGHMCVLQDGWAYGVCI